MITIEDFIKANGLTAEVEPREVNPIMDEYDPEWARTANHWLVTIKSTLTGGSMEVPFSQGSAHTEPPKLEDVLDCIASDASGIDGVEFDDWASDLGYFPINSQKEYRRAVKAYEATKKHTDELRNLLGKDAFSTLLWDVERL